MLTWFNARRAAETASWVDHTKTVLGEIDASLANVIRDTAIVRGYLLTGDLAFLETFDPTGSDVLAHLSLLGRLTAGNPSGTSSRTPSSSLRPEEVCRFGANPPAPEGFG